MNIKTKASICCFVIAFFPFTLFAEDEFVIDKNATLVEHDAKVFRNNPDYKNKPYNAQAQVGIYDDKHAVDTPSPLLEIGRPLYGYGPFKESGTAFGEKNPNFTQFYIYGDWRTAVGSNKSGQDSFSQVATQLNLDIDYKITGTERIHASMKPLEKDGKQTACRFNSSTDECTSNLDANLDTLFFEGELGSIASGVKNNYVDFDTPFAVGLMPLLFQNGVWLEDAFTGLAVSSVAMNSPSLDISNADVTLFAGFDKVSSAAVLETNGDVADSDVSIYGASSFIESNNGYWELGLAYTDDKTSQGDQDYYNATVAFSRRYAGKISNSTRIISNFGQKRDEGREKTADGILLLSENSFVSSKPSTVVPYLNLFAGFNRPQSLARDENAGGVLKNTGILFQGDALTGLQSLDATAQNTYGGAIGVEYLFNLDQQLVLEYAALDVIDDNKASAANGVQQGVGVRFQKALTKDWIFRTDAIHAKRENDDDISGIRFELRKKF